MLNSIKVLDLSRVLAGPLATMTLGDLGASIIKVERPGSGDDTRGWGPPFDDRGESAYYLSVNRNKKSIALDLNDATDRDIIARLAAGSDVVVDNFRVGTLESRGIDPDAILESNPRLIWCTITGFGESNPRAGYDLVVQAESGWMSITGEPGRDPMKVGVALADIIAGKDAVIAILAALVARDSLAIEDRRIHISLSASATAALINVAQNALVTGHDAKRWGNQHPNLVPYQLFHASDRPMIVAVGSDSQWKACAIALGLEDLAEDSSLASNAGRLDQRHRVVDAVAARLRDGTAAEWIEKLDAAGVPCGTVKTVLEALRDADASPLTGIAPSVPGSVRLPPPKLNEHGDEIRSKGWGSFDG
ncbi:MAG TPA: CoA transferase [Gemmatimonadaceae bacterium]|nr:CoA transferase [Gemmatimonadaceae bacterium]